MSLTKITFESLHDVLHGLVVFLSKFIQAFEVSVAIPGLKVNEHRRMGCKLHFATAKARYIPR